MKCDGIRAETRFRLSAKRTSQFNSAGVSVQSTTGSRGVRISSSNVGYTMFRSSVKSTGYPLYSLVSPFTSTPVRHRVPSHFNWSLPTALSAGLKQPGCETDQSPRCTAVFKKGRSCTSIPFPPFTARIGATNSTASRAEWIATLHTQRYATRSVLFQMPLHVIFPLFSFSFHTHLHVPTVTGSCNVAKFALPPCHIIADAAQRYAEPRQLGFGMLFSYKV